MASTKNLARALGFVRKRSTHQCNKARRPKLARQIFAYLIVLDFESTCWNDGHFRTQEIIEFPAVLLNTSTGAIECEFHHYVQPQESPFLSSFCKELTGISQNQVDEGIPIQLCLKKFCHWMGEIQKERGIIFSPASGENLCTFVTWSDWDLGVCLLNECKRKQLLKPKQLNHWIDLRATYKNFYNHNPKGLNGALQDLGIGFKGREHSGLDDAQNTAILAWRMICDGCVMTLTKTLAATPAGICSGNTSENNRRKDNDQAAAAGSKTKLINEQNVGTSKQSWKKKHSTSQGLPSYQKSQISLCTSDLEIAILQNPQGAIPHHSSNPASKNSSTVPLLENEKVSHSPKQSNCQPNLKRHGSNIEKPIIPETIKNLDNSVICSDFLSKELNRFYTTATSAKTVIVTNKSCGYVTVGPCCNEKDQLKNNFNKKRKSKFDQENTGQKSRNQTAAPFCGKHDRSELPGQKKVTTKGILTAHAFNAFQTPISVTFNKLKTSNNNHSYTTLKSLSSSTRIPEQMSVAGTYKKTPPLCKCGKRAKQRVVQSPGPNLGRCFYVCGVRTNSRILGCDFFHWESS